MKRWLIWTLLSLVIAVGFFTRFDSLAFWMQNPQRFFFDDGQTPLTLTVDAYYYLDVAKSLQKGTYQAFDERRRVPDGLRRSATPAFISVLAAAVSSISGASLEWVAILLPPFWGALIGLAVYGLAERLGRSIRLPLVEKQTRQRSAAQIMGLLAALTALLSPHLSVRSSIGWFDTDGLNVLFSCLAVWLVLGFYETVDDRRKYQWFTAWSLCFVFFLWVWDQSHVAVIALAATPMGLALLLEGLRAPKRVWRWLLPAVAMIFLVGFWKGFDAINPWRYLSILANSFDYFKGEIEQGYFPGHGAFVSEQSGADFAAIAKHTVGLAGAYLLGLCAAGLALLLIFDWRKAFFLAPLILVAGLSFEARRFEIFVAPLAGIGLGFFAFVIWQWVENKYFRSIGVCLLFLLVSWSNAAPLMAKNLVTPRRSPVLFEAMRRINELAPEDAVTWASWGHGHPLVFYTDRGTIGDGIYHPSQLSYVINMPLAASSFRLAANWMQFYVAQGATGLTQANQKLTGKADNWPAGQKRLKRLLDAGVEQSRQILQREMHWPPEKREDFLKFLFPQKSRPIVLFLGYLHADSGWYGIGAWDFEKRSYPPNGLYLRLAGLQTSTADKDMIRAQSRSGLLTINIDKGWLQQRAAKSPLQKVVVYGAPEPQEINFKHNSPLQVQLNPPYDYGVVGTEDRLNTVFNALYVGLRYDSQYFKPLELKPNVYELWSVTGDAYSAPQASLKVTADDPSN
ncbi:MAG: hypothetical protein KZQ58_03670 [gamma proteobacterium symbiont of Bathyaustriella thionipta]|nr:hypothetical protein [gamma proteobacterium symbiont of Bathyaustriella thionipta]